MTQIFRNQSSSAIASSGSLIGLTLGHEQDHYGSLIGPSQFKEYIPE